MTSRSAWKNSERRHSRLIGTERAPLSGSNGKITASDSLSRYWFLETKHRTDFPLYIDFGRIVAKANDLGRKPLMVFNSEGSQFAVLKFRDFSEMAYPEPHDPDPASVFLSPKWYIQMRYEKQFPFKQLFSETAEKARLEGKVPIVGIHVSGKRNDMLLTTLEIFLAHLIPGDAATLTA